MALQPFHQNINVFCRQSRRIKNRNLQEKAHDFANHEMLEESLEPEVHATATSTEAITNELIPIKEKLEQLSKLVKPKAVKIGICLLYTSPSPRDRTRSRMPSSA